MSERRADAAETIHWRLLQGQEGLDPADLGSGTAAESKELQRLSIDCPRERRPRPLAECIRCVEFEELLLDDAGKIVGGRCGAIRGF